MAVVSEPWDVVEFACRHCGALLEMPPVETSIWLRCPTCNRGNLPRERGADPSLLTQSASDLSAAEQTAKDAEVEAEPEEHADAAEGVEVETRTSVRRVVAGSVLFLSLTMLVISVLDQSPNGGTIFGTIAVASTGVLSWPVSKGSKKSRRSR